MRPDLPLLLILSAVLPLGLHAKDPSQIDASKQNTRLAPTPESADTPLSPGRETNQRTFFRNDRMQDQRFRTPDVVERKDAIIGERRAPIEMKETREKNIVERKDFPKPEVRERVMNRHDGEKSYIQPKGDQLKKFDTVTKYQERMTNASNAVSQRQPLIEKRTTFEKLNRFSYKRNGPGSPGNPVVTPAAGGPPPPSQDTYTEYKVDWKRLDATP